MIPPHTLRAPYRPKLDLPLQGSEPRTTSFLQRLDRGWDRFDRRCGGRCMRALFWMYAGMILLVAWALVYFWWTA